MSELHRHLGDVPCEEAVLNPGRCDGDSFRFQATFSCSHNHSHRSRTSSNSCRRSSTRCYVSSQERIKSMGPYQICPGYGRTMLPHEDAWCIIVQLFLGLTCLFDMPHLYLPLCTTGWRMRMRGFNSHGFEYPSCMRDHGRSCGVPSSFFRTLPTTLCFW